MTKNINNEAQRVEANGPAVNLTDLSPSASEVTLSPLISLLIYGIRVA